jgi:ferritin-like protein
VSLTRGQFVGLAVCAGALGAEPALGQPGGVDRVERLLEFEHRLEAAYGAALERGAIDAPLGRTLLAHEREHVRGVELALRTLGGRVSQATVSPPEPASALRGRRAFARFALALETQTVAAYAQVLATLDAPGLLQPLGSIMTSGAQHQVALRELLGEPPLGR